MALEAWLRGPVDGVPATLMPAAHALIQAGEDVRSAASGLSVDELWARPGGAASVGFHLQHIVGALDRLLTYAAGRQLDPDQLARVSAEGSPASPTMDAVQLLEDVDEAIRRALDVLRSTPDDSLFQSRDVGRRRLPSNVLGLLFHAAEHTQRHAGQVITTAKIVRGS